VRRPVMAIITLVMALVLPMGSAVATPTFPDSIPLPDGFYPEGITIGTGSDFYVGSLLDGAVYKGDLRSGEGAVLVDGAEGRVIAGLAFDRRSGLLWAAASQQGVPAVYAFDARSGDLVHRIPINGTFLNDLVVTRDALYVTDSLSDVLWTLPLTTRGTPGDLPSALPLTGDFTFVTEGELPINLNGIEATPNGKALIAVHTTLGVLYRIDPETGETTEIDLGGGAVASGDGIVLRGRTLYVVQNFLNAVAVVELAPDLASGTVVDTITSDLFRVPTTAALFGSDLYLVNARFDIAPPPLLGGDVQSVDYDVVRVRGR
jgi:hypothetical protein